MRSNVFSSPVSPNWPQLKSSNPEWGKQAVKFMPIYLFIKIDNKVRDLVLFGTKSGTIEAFDLNSGETVWSAKLKTGFSINGAMAYDEKQQLVYGLAKKPSFDPSKNNTTYILYSINPLNGKIHEQKIIHLGEIYRANNDFNYQFDPRLGVQCKTALGITQWNEKSLVYFGCSMNNNAYTKNADARPYHKFRGIRGSVIGVPVHQKKMGSLKIFFTSKIDKNDSNTGYDTGVFDAGAGPPALANKYILVSTGNGPLISHRKNYGCSLVRVDLSDFQSDQKNEFVSLDTDGFSECYTSNIDYSAGPAFLVTSPYKSGESIGVHRDQIGNILVFDPKKLSGSERQGRIEINGRIQHNVSGHNYSQGAIFNEKGKVHFIVTLAGNWNLKRNIFATKTEEEDLKKIDYAKNQCVGFISSKKTGAPLDLYYSGPTLNHLVLIEKSPDRHQFMINDQIEKSIGHLYWGVRGQKLPFKKWKTIGYSVTSNQKLDSKLKTAQFYVSVETSSSADHVVNYLNALKKELPPLHKPYLPPSGQFLIVEDPKECENPPHKDLVPLYEYNRPQNKFHGTVIVRYSILSDLKSQLQWSFQSENGMTPHRSATVAVKGKSHNYAVTATHNPADNTDSQLLFNSLETGKILATVPFKGEHHFSSPLVTRRGIILSTRNDGLVWIKY